MSINLPPLGPFKAFEAASRHQSFTKAAGELNLTQAAISQQIKQLEYQLGFDFFTRYPRKLVLTDKGAALALTVRSSLGAISDKILQLQSGRYENSLSINTMQSFAMKWLIPRLTDFHHANPGIDIRLNTEERNVDLAAEGIDVVFRASRGPDPMLACHRMCDETYVAVYSPDLIGDKDRLIPDQLAEYPLLHWGDLGYWKQWISAAGLRWQDFQFSFSHSHLGNLVQGAVAGQGVGLAPLSLASHDILTGRLLIIENNPIPAEFDYYFMCPPEIADNKLVARFRDWVTAQVAETDEFIDASR